MAGHYFYDPRPYYGLNMSTNLMPLDALFYKYEPVPYWMDQRMAPMSYPDYHSGHVKEVMIRRPEVQQFLPYNRPELAVRDDIYTDTYKRSPHFTGFGLYPEMRQPRAHSQDDTYLHTMTSQYVSPQNQFPQQGIVPQRGYGAVAEMPMPMPMPMPMGYMGNVNGGQQTYMRQGEMVPVHGHMNNQNFPNQRYNSGEQMDVTSKGNKAHGSNNGNSNESYNNDDDYGTKIKKKTLYTNDDDSSNKSSSKSSKQEMYNDDYGYGNKSSSKKMHSNDDNYNSKSSGNTNYGTGTKQGSAKQQKRNTKDDWSSDDEDEYGNHKSGGKWGTKPALKQEKRDTYTHGKNEMGSKKSGKSSGDDQSYGGNNMVVYDFRKKQSGQNQGSQSNSSSKIRYMNGGDSCSDEDESYAYTKKAMRAEQHNQGVTKVQHSHGHGGKERSRGFDSHVQSYGQQPQHTQFHSQMKSVELKVPICCDNCERKVTACLEYIDGVESVLCDQWQKKVIVYGNVKPDVVLKRVKKVKKASELWQQTPKRVPVY